MIEATRQMDLIRHQRAELHEAGLITDAEYAELSGLSGSPERLMAYDAVAQVMREAVARGDQAVQKLADVTAEFAVKQRAVDAKIRELDAKADAVQREVKEQTQIAQERVRFLTALLENLKKDWSGDRPLEEDAEIESVHPASEDKPDFHTYNRAMALVGAKHSKYGLVNLVNWLLRRYKTMEQIAGDHEKQATEMMLERDIELRRAHTEIEGVLQMQGVKVVRCQEGSGPENIFATLALSVGATIAQYNDAIKPTELERMFQIFEDTKKVLHYNKHQGTWAWADRGEVAIYGEHPTALAALKDAIAPYLEESE